MDNILPKFKTFSLYDEEKDSTKKVRPTRWEPERAVVEEDRRFPYFLGNDIESDDESQEGDINPPLLPPNDRYLAEAKGIGPSPLSLSERYKSLPFILVRFAEARLRRQRYQCQVRQQNTKSSWTITTNCRMQCVSTTHVACRWRYL